MSQFLLKLVPTFLTSQALWWWIGWKLLVVVLLYLVGRLYQTVQSYRVVEKTYRKIPDTPRFGLVGYLLGSLDVVYYCMSHLTPSKATFQEVASISATGIEQGFQRTTILFDRVVYVYRAKPTEALLTNSHNLTKSDDYHVFDRWFGNGLLISAGDHWRLHRKVLTPAFHFRILDSFVSVMNECCGEMIASIINHKSRNQSLDIRPLIATCTLNTICETAMGLRIGAQSHGSELYVKPLSRVLELITERLMNPLIHLDTIYNLTKTKQEFVKNLDKVQSFVRNVIDERSKERPKIVDDNVNDGNGDGQEETKSTEVMGGKRRYALMDTLLLEHFKNPNEFSVKDIEDEVNTFMFGGHDTTAAALTFALLLIGGDQQVQDKIYAELESIFGPKEEDDDRQPSSNRSIITTDDCRQMKYLEQCIKESLRLYPPVPVIGRKIEHDFEMNGYTIPAGCQCMVYVYSLHRDPSVFPQPERFLPDRFAPEADIHRQPYAFLPFSAGPRNCIGQKFAMLEMKVVIASLLRQFRLTSITKRDQVDVEISVVMKARTPVMIQFEQR